MLNKLKYFYDTLIVKYKEFRYLDFPEFYMDQILFRWQHYICGQRCQNCRNWIYMGRLKSLGKVEIGHCSIWNEDFLDYHGHCFSWNHDFTENERGFTHDEDRSEMPMKTPAGKWITVVSRNGRWMYLYDGMPKWYD
jgi:hypothetical protein